VGEGPGVARARPVKPVADKRHLQQGREEGTEAALTLRFGTDAEVRN
jgi:hypothetical protein